MNHDETLKVTTLNLTDKENQQTWLDALETLCKDAVKAICAGDYERAEAMLDRADLIIAYPKQYSAFKKSVEHLTRIWPAICEADDVFTRYNQLSGNFATAVDPSDKLNTNNDDDEQQNENNLSD